MDQLVERTDRLYVPHRKRLAHACVATDSGARELCLYYGTKEVVFDDERFFAFGEQLVRQTSFAETATSWGPGYEWSELQPMLEALARLICNGPHAAGCCVIQRVEELPMKIKTKVRGGNTIPVIGPGGSGGGRSCA